MMVRSSAATLLALASLAVADHRVGRWRGREPQDCPTCSQLHCPDELTCVHADVCTIGCVYDCTVGGNWSWLKQQFCGKTARDAIPAPVSDTSPFPDCYDGTWWPEKREWCCTNHGEGCVDGVTCPSCASMACPALMGMRCIEREMMCVHEPCCPQLECGFDCSGADVSDEEDWNEVIRAWCCVREGKGCPDDNDSEGSGRLALPLALGLTGALIVGVVIAVVVYRHRATRGSETSEPSAAWASREPISREPVEGKPIPGAAIAEVSDNVADGKVVIAVEMPATNVNEPVE